ncbi:MULTISPECIES: PspA/IM30 family protein [unclassified Lysobacter]|uniref:PspA/IM30 family protein n=1 Tax=unclassified Lysobacter TaxID=2635362 RepID=UPI001C22E050|nr:PspA/IM30 family protein [Lysobacter sp. MMG2]MBU8978114.1 PspA/IM30 family protein [Lysobacter sp. MMG2]
MSALSRIFGRVREQLAELGDSIVPNAAQRDLDEEIRASDARVREWRASLAELLARRMTAQERTDTTAAAIEQREAQALASLQAGKLALAEEVAAAIAQLEQARDDEHALLAQLDLRVTQMRYLIEEGENGLRRLQLQLDALRAAETVQRAQETVAHRQPGTPLPQNAIESLLRSRRRNAPRAEADDAGEPMGDSDLDARLLAEGIDERNTRAQLVLARLAQRLADAAAASAPPTGGRATRTRTPGKKPR